MKKYNKIIIMFLILSNNCFCQPTSIVTKVIDGDTFEVNNIGMIKTIEIVQIDAPEKNQPFGIESKNYLKNLIWGNNVRIHSVSQYNNIIYATVSFEGRNISELILEKGYAWLSPDYYSNKQLKKIQDKSYSNKLGLWFYENPIPPWEYRDLPNKEKRNHLDNYVVRAEDRVIPKTTISNYPMRKRYPKREIIGSVPLEMIGMMQINRINNYSNYGSIDIQSGEIRVNPYTKKDGTFVNGYSRSR